jgi:Zn-dependent protease with chaperone function
MTSPTPLYPPTPPGIPTDLARPSLRYRLLVVLLLLGLFLFLLLYLALMAGALYLLLWAIAPPADVVERVSDSTASMIVFVLIRIGVFAASIMFFAFLFKGLCKRQADDSEHYLEVTEEQQPHLFEFVRALCKEIGSPFPARIYLNHEVNAAVFFPTSILSLVVPPKKNLLIGLGLINDVNVVELKAVLAHELGHFSQRSLRLSGYAQVVYRMIYNMVSVRDRWDNWMIQGFDTPWVSAFAVPLYVGVEWTRKLLVQVFRGIDLVHQSLRRQMELNADLVAVGVAGSDAPVHLLLQSELCQASFLQAQHDLTVAADHDLLTRDLFYHQHRAADRLRAGANGANLGRPAAPPPGTALPVQVIQPSDAVPAPMWADHPSHYDREQNAKRRYFPSPQDDRPAWLVFQDTDAVREEVTRLFYNICLDVEAEGPLEAPERVQAFLDEEQQALTFDARYRGAYDNRYLELGDLDEAVRDAETAGRPALAELVISARGLYSDKLASLLTEHRQRRDELARLSGLPPGERTGESKLREELEADRRSLAQFDRSVFLLHYHLAGHLGKQEELRQRYEFHLRLEGLDQITWDQRARVDYVLNVLSARQELFVEEAVPLKELLIEAHEGIANLYHLAGVLKLPPLKHVPAGEPLRCLLPAEPAAPDLTSVDTALNGRLLAVFQQQIALVCDKLGRTRVKSLGSILAFQEELVCAGEQGWEAFGATEQGVEVG